MVLSYVLIKFYSIGGIDMLEKILIVFMIIELFITLGIGCYIAYKVENQFKYERNFVLSSLWYYIKNLFTEKNWFGYIISLLVFILSIPAFIILLIIEAVGWICILFRIIWDLGNKK